MSDIKSEVHSVAPRWRYFGEALHLKPPSLDLMKRSSVDPEECLSNTLTEFLKKNYDLDKRGVPSWRLIVAAIGCKEGGNDKGLAIKIADNHPTERGQY